MKMLCPKQCSGGFDQAHENLVLTSATKPKPEAMIEERAELNARIEEIEAFLDSDAFRELHITDQNYLRHQRIFIRLMHEYCQALDSRIARCKG
jgi:hypothetical protein